MSTSTLLVRQDNLASTRLLTADDTPLEGGQVRVRVESFALTANNITYAALGDMLNYWQFFPTGEAGWGIVPVNAAPAVPTWRSGCTWPPRR